MAEIVGKSVNSNGYQALKAGYDNARQFINTNGAKGRVMSAMHDLTKEIERVPLLNSQTSQFSSTHKISVDLNSVRKEVVTEIAKLPADVNIEIADRIKAKINAGDFPKNKAESSQAVMDMIKDYQNFAAS
tara:strand:+ start:181 stop:573 length:393 start_codon:yes stop_codon:yes gene_type:complete